MKLRIYKTDCTNPYINLATEEYLTFNAAEDEVTMFLWQNARTVVIGKNQNPWRECNVEQIKADGVSLARRMSGGGAVYHDLGNLNFTFIARDGLYDIEKQTDVILLACRFLGINATKTGRNDLVVDGRKFSGHAYYSSKGYNYHHGTVMMNVIADDMPKYLRVSAAKLKSKGVESVRSRVVNLGEYLPGKANDVLIDEMQSAMVQAFYRTYLGKLPRLESAGSDGACGYTNAASSNKKEDCEGVRCSDGESSSENLRFDELPVIPQELIDKYSSEDWRLGSRIPFEKSIEHRFNWGEVQIQLAMKGEYIKTCKIYSDALETEMFGTLEQQLTGCKYDRETILSLKRAAGISANAEEILILIASAVE